MVRALDADVIISELRLHLKRRLAELEAVLDEPFCPRCSLAIDAVISALDLLDEAVK